MKILLIDNYDSYTYNLYQVLARFGDVQVLKNDDDSLRVMNFSMFHAVVVSPGPGNPANLGDFGYASTVYSLPELPVLGVCLGHQGLAVAAQGRVVEAPEPLHGFVGGMVHYGDPLFAGVPRRFSAVRYHSLSVSEPVSDDMKVIARSESDGLVMGLRHRRRPHWGVQFHPESVATTYGEQIIANFLNLALDWLVDHGKVDSKFRDDELVRYANVLQLSSNADGVKLAEFFDCMYGNWVWLDCARVSNANAKYSYFVPAGVLRNDLVRYDSAEADVLTIERDGLVRERLHTDVFGYLKSKLRQPKISNMSAIPGTFKGGYVGYFGYEMKAKCGLNAFHSASTPDSIWVKSLNYVVLDHVEDRAYAVEIGDSADGASWPEQLRDSFQEWSSRLGKDNTASESGSTTVSCSSELPDDNFVRKLARSRDDYVEQISKIKSELHKGNTYEVCLTNILHAGYDDDASLRKYFELRASNPAPYAAFLKLGGLTVYCSSPECFLTVSSDGVVRSRPIKGTAPRSLDPATDSKRREALAADRKTVAENLMIVDLVRNDLGRVCKPGSVTVPDYMMVESYETVHQLVSTIRGDIRDDRDTIDAIQASFPPGSMTGAPKVRTTDIIDRLETSARGIYSGSIGYLSYDGAADLNVVIRTAVAYDDEIGIGSGGAIVLDSDPDEEYREMLLKAKALVRVFL
ncbi:aminodeoxychorismate synthase component I [Actinomyces slackii]|uniref:aminodeoxychorismate synthase n=1 Tax=Actinomyces slackii TaxID=52774 RepID=A0A448KFP8_9ACTO|nr:aminodeoxychorismate synthase component I [Actinomyces slackii]VEG75774.1 Para-aminobenzoate synthase component 1 [Actinomyces slackii]